MPDKRYSSSTRATRSSLNRGRFGNMSRCGEGWPTRVASGAVVGTSRK
jgi:hypothetical protein